MKDACVRGLCNAPVKASANPDTSVTETQPRVNIKVPALVQKGVGAARSKVIPAQQHCRCGTQLSLCCPGRREAEAHLPRFLLPFPFLLVLLPFPQPGEPSWDGHPGTSPSLCCRKNRQRGCETTFSPKARVVGKSGGITVLSPEYSAVLAEKKSQVRVVL